MSDTREGNRRHRIQAAVQAQLGGTSTVRERTSGVGIDEVRIEIRARCFLYATGLAGGVRIGCASSLVYELAASPFEGTVTCPDRTPSWAGAVLLDVGVAQALTTSVAVGGWCRTRPPAVSIRTE